MNLQLLRKSFTYSRQIEQSKTSKATENLNDITNKRDLTTYIIAQHPTSRIYLFKQTGNNYKNIPGHKVNLNKYQRIGIIQALSLTIMPKNQK